MFSHRNINQNIQAYDQISPNGKKKKLFDIFILKENTKVNRICHRTCRYYSM